MSLRPLSACNQSIAGVLQRFSGVVSVEGQVIKTRTDWFQGNMILLNVNERASVKQTEPR